MSHTPAAPRTLVPTWFAGHLVVMVGLHFGWPVYHWNLGMTRWWGLPLALLGMWLVGASARRFAPVTTLRPDGAPSVLVTRGFFRWSRNPMYLGMLVSLVGGFVMLGSVTPAVAVPAFFWLVDRRFIPHEERTLEALFGDEYRAYRARVRRWI